MLDAIKVHILRALTNLPVQKRVRSPTSIRLRVVVAAMIAEGLVVEHLIVSICNIQPPQLSHRNAVSGHAKTAMLITKNS